MSNTALTFDSIELLDELLFNGTFVKEVEVLPKIKAEFRVRTAEEDAKLGKELANMDIKGALHADLEMGLLLLAFSTTSFAGKDLSELPAYPERYSFFSKYPSPIVDAALKRLHEFDAAVMKALSGDAVENF
jgi:hypothetical protein